MASNLPTIVNAIKAFSLNYNGKLAKVKDGLSIPNTAEIADLPMRIISATGTSGGQVRRLTLGGGPVLNFRWQIVDIMLGQQVGMNTGVKNQSTAMFQYAADYAEVVRSLVTNQYQIEDVSIQTGPIEWPAESGNSYYAVRCEFLVKEIIQ
jgi:hypothetical protein